MTDRWTDARKIMFLSHTPTMNGSDLVSLAEYRPVVQEKIA